MKLRVKGPDVRLAIGIVVGLFVAGVVLPLASPEGSGPGTLGVGTVGGVTDPAASGSEAAAGRARTGGTGPVATGVDGGPASAGGGTEAGGPSDTSTDGAVPVADGPGGPADGPRTASDQGVTPETITVGLALANLDTLNRTGVGASNGTVAQRQQVWEAIITDANRRGGAAGRTIEVVMADYDAIDPDGATSACRQLAEDHELFAMFGDVGWQRTAALCATRQYGLPNITYDPQDAATFSDAGGLLWTSLPSVERILHNHVSTLHDRGLLRGRRIGLVTSEGITDAYDTVEIPALQAKGYEVVHRSKLSEDASTAQSQIPVEIQQMRSKRVDFVIWEGGPLYSNFWIPSAQRSGFEPTYSFSEFNSGSDDFSIQTVTEEIDAYAWSSRRKIERRTDRQAARSDADCVSAVSKATGIAMARDEDLYWETARYCAHVAAFADAANAAGANPTRQSFAAAFSNLGARPDYDVGPSGTGGSFVPGKPEAADHLHAMRHRISCRCWQPEGDWFPMKPIGR